MATVKLFGNLREITSLSTMEIPGETVADLLNALCRQFEPLQEALFDGQTLRAYVRVVVNGRDIELALGLNTKVSDTSTVAIFPPIAGGR